MDIKVDIKEKIEEIVKKVKSDKNLKKKFEKEPVKVIEEILGVDLPDELIMKIIDGAKEKLDAETVTGIAGKLFKLFGKKK